MSSDNLSFFLVVAEKRHRFKTCIMLFLVFNLLNQMLIFELMQSLSMEMIFNIIIMNSIN